MEPLEKKAYRLSDRLLDSARSDLDIESATLLRHLGRLYAVAREVVRAKTNEQKISAYAELVDVMNGKDE